MFRPQIQKSSTLIAMATVTMFTIFWMTNSIEFIPENNLEEKKVATKTMSTFIESINKIPGNIKDENDIYSSGLIGLEYSEITSIVDDPEKSFLKSKIACTHPNFSALIVNLFNESELKKGDTIAVSMTGSLPGANIALLAACHSFDITPIIISSVASSAWGVNKKNLTWIDIESHLYNDGVIDYDYKSKAVSIGGKGDVGDNLTEEGIVILEESIIRNDLQLINEDTLEKNINKKIGIYSQYLPIENYRAFINIGGNSSSIGMGGVEKDTMRVGVIFPIERNDMIEENNNFKNSIANHFLNNDVVFINIKNIAKLSTPWELYPPDISIENNVGRLFYSQEPFTIITILISLMINIIIISVIGLQSHYEIKKRMQNEEYDSIL